MNLQRLRKAKRLEPPFLLRDPERFHIHPSRKRVPNPYEMDYPEEVDGQLFLRLKFIE